MKFSLERESGGFDGDLDFDHEYNSDESSDTA